MIANCDVKDSGKWPLPILHFFSVFTHRNRGESRNNLSG